MHNHRKDAAAKHMPAERWWLAWLVGVAGWRGWLALTGGEVDLLVRDSPIPHRIRQVRSVLAPAVHVCPGFDRCDGRLGLGVDEVVAGVVGRARLGRAAVVLCQPKAPSNPANLFLSFV